MNIEVTATEAVTLRRMVEQGWEPDAALAHLRETSARARKRREPLRVPMPPENDDLPAPQPQSEKRHKYGAKPVTIDGHRFPSQAEGRRYEELKLLRDNGAIKGLELQPRYKIRIGGIHVTTYVADFRYVDIETGETVVEDVKGFVTDVYKLKKKLVKAVHGIEIQEIRA